METSLKWLTPEEVQARVAETSRRERAEAAAEELAVMVAQTQAAAQASAESAAQLEVSLADALHEAECRELADPQLSRGSTMERSGMVCSVAPRFDNPRPTVPVLVLG